jgi:hypothetical protein
VNEGTTRGIATALALGALLALLLARGGGTRTPSEPAPAALRPPPTTTGPTRPAASVTITTHAPAALPATGAPSLAVLQQSLTDYLAVSVYPPWSHPHAEGTADKLAWNDPIADDLPWDNRPGENVVYRFDADKAHVPYGEALTSWIEVIKTGARPEHLPVAILEAWVVSNSGPSQGQTIAVAYNDEGRDGDRIAGDRIYTSRFVPSAVPQLQTSAQSVQIRAIIDANGAAPRPILRDFTYAPRNDIAILGGAESIQDGTLVVDLDVDVHQAGIYTFEANVMAGDEPIAYAEPSYTLPLGKQHAALKFFGRAFVEKKQSGPYVVRDIRCFHRFIQGEEENFYATYDGTITTRPYTVAQFSSAEWSDPEKDETIANLSRLIEQTKNGEIGQPIGPAVAGGGRSDPIR